MAKVTTYDWVIKITLDDATLRKQLAATQAAIQGFMSKVSQMSAGQTPSRHPGDPMSAQGGYGPQQQVAALAKSYESVAQAATRASATAQKYAQATEKVADAAAKTKAKTAEQTGVMDQLQNSMVGAIARGAKWALIYTIIYRGMRRVTNSLGEATEATVALELAMARIGVVTGASASELSAASDAAFGLAVKYGVAILDIAEGMRTWAQQGYSLNESLRLTETALLGANVTGATVTNTISNLTAAIRGFGIPIAESERILDKWIAVAAQAAVDVQDLADATKRAASTAQMAGVTFDEFVGHIAAIGEITRESGTQVATALRMVYIRSMRELTDSVLEARAGISIYADESKSSFRDFGAVLDELAGKWDRLSEPAQRSIVEQLAGARRYNQFAALMRNYSRAIESTIISETSYGRAQDANQRIMATAAKQFEQTKQALLAAGRAILDTGILDYMVNFSRGVMVSAQSIAALTSRLGGMTSVLREWVGSLAIGLAAVSAIAFTTGQWSIAIVAAIAALGLAYTQTMELKGAWAEGPRGATAVARRAEDSKRRAEEPSRRAEEFASALERIAQAQKYAEPNTQPWEDLQGILSRLLDRYPEFADELTETTASLRVQAGELEAVAVKAQELADAYREAQIAAEEARRREAYSKIEKLAGAETAAGSVTPQFYTLPGFKGRGLYDRYGSTQQGAAGMESGELLGALRELREGDPFSEFVSKLGEASPGLQMLIDEVRKGYTELNRLHSLLPEISEDLAGFVFESDQGKAALTALLGVMSAVASTPMAADVFAAPFATYETADYADLMASLREQQSHLAGMAPAEIEAYGQLAAHAASFAKSLDESYEAEQRRHTAAVLNIETKSQEVGMMRELEMLQAAGLDTEARILQYLMSKHQLEERILQVRKAYGEEIEKEQRLEAERKFGESIEAQLDPGKYEKLQQGRELLKNLIQATQIAQEARRRIESGAYLDPTDIERRTEGGLDRAWSDIRRHGDSNVMSAFREWQTGRREQEKSDERQEHLGYLKEVEERLKAQDSIEADLTSEIGLMSEALDALNLPLENIITKSTAILNEWLKILAAVKAVAEEMAGQEAG